MRNYDKQAILSADKAHHFHPFTHHDSLWQEDKLWAVGEAKGSYLTTLDGKKILDFMSGLWCVNVGYGRKEIADAVHAQMLELNYYNTFFQSTMPSTAQLSEKLASLLGSHLPYIFYGSSGSESNDTIVRAVRVYWQLQGHRDKRIIISRDNAYHGSTLAGANLGGMSLMHRQAGLEVSDITHICQPYAYGLEKNCDDLEAFGLKSANALETEILKHGADKVAAFIGEPIQGAGGVIIPPSNYWHRIEEICRKYDILLIADEVICGFGRTGHWFGHQHFGFKPDLVTMAKGISSGYVPLSAVAMSSKIAAVLAEGGGNEFAHGYTYSGHPVACAAALANIAIIENENLVENVKNRASVLLSQALAEVSTHPIVSEVRNVGLIGAIELSPNPSSQADFETSGAAGAICRNHCLQQGIILRARGDTMVMAPPLIIGKNEIDEMLSKLWIALDNTQKDLNL